MHRFFVEKSAIEGSIATLSKEEAAHMGRVLRQRVGETVELCTGEENFCARILSLTDASASLEITSPLPSRESGVRITLYQGLPKADKMELIVQKATELGVHAICPVRFARCDVKLDEKSAQKKVERWQKIVVEAAKQCGRAHIPHIAMPVSVKELAQKAAQHGLALCPWEEGGAGFYHALSAKPQDSAIIIGPEGGIDKSEVRILQEKGVQTVTLGARILRTETAAISSIAAAMCCLGQWEDYA